MALALITFPAPSRNPGGRPRGGYRPVRRRAGFSLIEMVVALAIGAIALTVTAPTLNVMLKNNRLTATTNSLATAFNYARTEAINRNANVSVVSNSGGDWSQGWEVQDDTGNTLRSFAAAPGSITIDSTTGIGSFTFGSNGRLTPATDTLAICDDDRTGETGRTLAVGVRGRISVSDRHCS